MEEQRLDDLRFLNRYYDSNLSNILVVYGHRNIEKSRILQKFIENRRFIYYTARSVSYTEQLFLWAKELKDTGIDVPEYPDFTTLFETCLKSATKNPLIFVIRNFEHIVKADESFFKDLCSLLDKHGKNRQIMVLLVSDDINWVENSMVSSLGNLSANISGFRKIKPLPFSQLRSFFPNMSYKDACMTYSVLGGQTRLWRYFDGNLSFKENVCKNILDEGAFLHEEALRLTAENLRETAVYHTILSNMARGVNKLNDLHHATKFSRAKISVYLKTLIHHDFAYKAYSFGNAGRENVVKGVYKIADPLLDFYFRFIFPNLSALSQMSAEKFYDIFISAGMQSYICEYFKSICREYIFRCEAKGVFPFEIEEDGEWLGKDGDIDIIVQSDTGDTAIGMAVWQRQVTHADLVALQTLAKKARLEGDIVYLFSTIGFDAWLIDAAMKPQSNIRLIGIDELTNG